ncbi:MAG TPA: pitrilysin family protein [Thiobacillaceae bacterium]|nr:pitrilysin family protein [Thiobacillaceae bacterium]
MITDLLPRLLLALAAWTALAAHAALPIQHWTTAEGARVYFVESHNLPMLDVSVDFPAGSAYDAPDKAGLARLTQVMLDQGAGQMSEEEIANRLADVGAELGGRFDRDRAGVTLRTLSSAKERSEALAILVDVLQHPHFPDAAFQRERNRMLAELKEQEAQPEDVADKAFYRAVYGTHPYGLPESGTARGLNQVKQEDLARFHAAHYVAAGAVISMIGDLSRTEAEQLAARISAGLPTGPAPASIAAPVAVKPETLKLSLPSTQSHILMGLQGMSRTDPDYFPLYVGNYVLGGGGFDSRLLEEERQKRGYAYSAYSYFNPLVQPGPLEIGLQTRQEHTEDALKVAHETVQNFVAQGPTQAELTQAKGNLVGGFPLRLDTNKKILEYLAAIGFYRLPLNYLDTWTSKVQAVSLDQVRDAFRRRVNPDALSVVVVGPQATQ